MKVSYRLLIRNDRRVSTSGLFLTEALVPLVFLPPLAQIGFDLLPTVFFFF